MDKSQNGTDLRNRIFRVRGQQVMIGQDLATLYGVQTKVLQQAVRRNVHRFPPDFMFQLSLFEFENLKSQFVTSSWGGLRRARPYAFTEHGVAMLSCVLRSREAVAVSLAILRAFIQLRRAVLAHRDLGRRVEQVEGRLSLAETDIRLLSADVRSLKDTPEPYRRHVRGFSL